MGLFSDILNKVKKRVSQTPYLRVLPKAISQSIDEVPRFHFADKVGQHDTNPVIRIGKQFVAGAAQDLVNTPSDLIQGGGRTIRNQIKKTAGIKMRPQDELADAGQLGGALLNLATLGLGGSAVKQVGKQTVKELLKKSAITGAKVGTGYGAVEGLKTGRDINDPKKYIENVIKKTATGTAIGAGSGLALGAGGKLISKGVKEYNKIPVGERQAGKVDFTAKIDNPLSEVVKKRVEGLVKSDSQKAKTSEDFAKLNSTIDFYSKKFGHDKAFVAKLLKAKPQQKVEDALYLVDDQAKAGQIPVRDKKAYVVQALKTDNFTKPAEELSFNNKTARSEPSFTPKESLKQGKAVKEILSDASSPAPIVPKVPDVTIKAITQPKQVVQSGEIPSASVQGGVITNTGQPITRRLLDELPDKKLITDPNTHVQATAEGSARLGDRLAQEKKFIDDNGLDPVTVGKVWDEKIVAPNDLYQEAADRLRAVNDEVYHIRTQRGQIGYNPKMPHVFDTEVNQLEQFFTSHSNASQILDDLLVDTHRLQRNDTGVGYNENPIDAVYTSGTRAIQDYLKPRTKAQEEVIEHVNKLEAGKEIDYVEKLGEGIAKKGEVAYEIKTTLPSSLKSVSAIRQRNNVMEKIGGEIYDKYRSVVDSYDLIPQRQVEMSSFIENKDANGMINYLSDLINPENKDAFVAQSLKEIERRGFDSYANKMLFMANKKNLQDFIDTVAQYTFKDPKTKRVVNQFIDDRLKLEKAKLSLQDQILNTSNRIFSMAQIGGNVKVALMQSLDLLRLPVNYKPQEIISGLQKAFTEPLTLEKKYGFQDSYNQYTQESSMKGSGTISKEVGKVMEKLSKVPEAILYGPLKAVEGFKNRVYIGAAEAMGREQGLEGEALTRFVREQVFKRANIAHRENTPLFLKDSSFNRAIFQYSQFAVKNLVEIKDALDEKAMARAVGLLVANTTGALITASITGLTLSKAMQGIFPTGVGPIASVPIDLWTNWQQYQDQDEAGNSTAYNAQRIKDLLIGNFIPGGTQFNKTSKMADILGKGYADTASGRVKYAAPTNPLEQAKGLIFGNSSTKSNQDFYNSGDQPLGTGQSDEFRALQQNDPEAAKLYLQGVQENRQAKKADKLGINGISSGGNVNSNVNPTGGVHSIDDIILKDQAEKDTNEAISKVLFGKEYKNLSDQQKMSFLSSKGIGQDQITDFYTGKLKSADAKDRADWITQQNNVDFTKLYKLDVLTPEVAKELERKGFIDDADSLMEKMKMTDVYYQKKALRKAQKSHIKDMLKLQGSLSKKLLNNNLKNSKNIQSLIRKSRTGRKKIKKTTITKPSLKLGNLAAPKPYNTPLPKYKF